MSLCARCYDPGQCCRGFALFNADGTERTFWVDGDGTVDAFVKERDLPFVPREIELFTDGESGRRYARVTFNCGALTEDGRCSTYRRRPDVCREFEPASSPLCVHFGGAEGTGDGL